MPSLPADSTPRSPGDFADILATKEPVVLVGGQAVNLWAIYYWEQTAELAPFTSRDADVLGDRETLRELARIAGAKPQIFPIRPPTNEVGVVIARGPTGAPMLIEVLRYVRGVTNEELRDPAYKMALGEHEVEVQVPGPIALFQAKLANVAGINQTHRQDVRHAVILARLMPAYLADLQKAAVEGKLEERKFITFLERLLAVVTTKVNQRVLREAEIDPRKLFAGLDGRHLPKLAAFLEKRLRRAWPAKN
ncbi:MAG: hypothetical protein ABI222_10765 [Opitutaceae bacterium]